MRRLPRLLQNRAGIAVVEFALLLPLMVLIYFGAVETSLLLQVDRKVTKSASTLGDLVSRETSISDAEIADIFDASRLIFQPFSNSAARLRISSLVVDKNTGEVKVDWSDASGAWSALTAGTVVTPPSDLVPTSGSLILAEVELPYASKIGYVVNFSHTLKDTFYLRPRQVEVVSRVTN